MAVHSLDTRLLQSGRAVCPKCGKKGVGYAAHPHAYGWKDYDRASCRYCRARFKMREPQSEQLVQPQDVSQAK
jgi:hypothetical protein